MAGLNHHSDSPGLNQFHDGLGYLHGQILLVLQAPREDFRDASHLRQAEHFAFGKIADVAYAIEGEHVVFAQGVDLDVADDDHLVHRRLENGSAYRLFDGLGVSFGEKPVGFVRPPGGVHQPLSVRVFAQPLDELFEKILHVLTILPQSTIVVARCVRRANRTSILATELASLPAIRGNSLPAIELCCVEGYLTPDRKITQPPRPDQPMHTMAARFELAQGGDPPRAW